MHNQELTQQTVDSIDQSASAIVDAFQANVIAQMSLLSDSMAAASKVAALTSKLAVRASVLEMVSRSAERVAAMIDRLPGDGALHAAAYRVMISEMVDDAVDVMASIGVPPEATRGAMLATFPKFAEAIDHRTPTHYHDGSRFVRLG